MFARVFVLALVVSASSTASAAARVGVGLAYGADIEEPGLQGSAYFDLPAVENLRLGGDIILYLPDSRRTFGADVSAMFFEINANAQYVFLQETDFRLYGLGGLNLMNVRSSVDYDPDVPLDDDSDINSELGLNLGAGAEFALNFGALYGELKYVLGDADQLVLGAGVRFALGE